ncbi:unnamed protein product [Withania somnifera]
MVSIGPYHKEKRQLRPMEKYKLLYLQRFLKRREGLDVQSCISELEKLKDVALKCSDDIKYPGNDQFLEMLLLDGCFVVEFIRETNEAQPESRIIKPVGFIYDQIPRDLMLLENQLPFFVLNQLHRMTILDGNELSFAILAKKAFAIYSPKTSPEALQEIKDKANAGNIKHLLHLIHMSWQGNPDIDSGSYGKRLCCNLYQIICSNGKPKDKEEKVIPNATELSEAGVSFTNVGNIYRSSENDDIGDTSLFYIKFKNGLIKIPRLQVFDSTESNLRNLIAFEQQSEHHRYFSDFAIIMDHLIESDKDVNLLRQKGIIDNRIGEDKEVTRIFNQIGKGVSVSDDFYERDGYKKAIQHCEIPCNRLKASLKHNYFSSLWVGATVAAIILLILTTIQTVLAFTGN